MCGIFGYVGSRTAAPLLLEGLRTLEYRGYDSAGIYVPGYGMIKAVGPIDELAKKLPETLPGVAGIAHTRWATHGEPTERNAHPHADMAEKIWIVHNGIIENFREIKEILTLQGMSFSSDTDTEVLAKLIGSFYDGDLSAAVQRALAAVRGTYGIAVMSEYDPQKLIVARMGSPIVLGFGRDGNFIASDPSALLTHTKDVIFLNDGEMAILTKDTYEVTTVAGKKINRTAEVLEWEVEAVQKGGYEHFMLKEIFEAPQVIENTIRGRLIIDKGMAKLGGLESMLSRITALKRLQIVGCGSAYYAGQVGRYMLEEYAGIPVEVELASEYRYKKSYPDKKGAVLAISQSGETADTLASLKKAKAEELLTLGIVNAVGSTIARETDAGVYNHAGPEVAVASTKAFISQLTVLALFTLLIARQRGMSMQEGQEIARGLEALPQVLTKVLEESDRIKAVAERFAEARDFMYIGRHLHAPIAYEGSLKIKEVSYVHAEAYAGGELKHGPIAMLDADFPVVAIAPKDSVYEKMISNIEEVKARKAPIIMLTTSIDAHVKELADEVLLMPQVHPLLQPIVATVPLQLFAYHFGVAKGLNVDRPRNLAKSVTVE